MWGAQREGRRGKSSEEKSEWMKERIVSSREKVKRATREQKHELGEREKRREERERKKEKKVGL